MSWEIPEPNYTAYIMFLLVLFSKVSHVTHSFETRSKTPANVLEPHGPSMYILSICRSKTRSVMNTLKKHLSDRWGERCKYRRTKNNNNNQEEMNSAIGKSYF